MGEKSLNSHKTYMTSKDLSLPNLLQLQMPQNKVLIAN